MMLYNLPPATGVNLTPETVGRLAREVDNIRYIKDTSGDLAQAGKLMHPTMTSSRRSSGWDSLFALALTEGVAGVMGGTANVMPAELVPGRAVVRDGGPQPPHAGVDTASTR